MKKNCYKIENDGRNSGVTYHVRIASSGWVESEGIGSLSMQPFRATSGNRKWTVFLFTHQILSVFNARDDYFENPGERTFLAREMLTSGLRPWLENVAFLSSLLSWLTDVSRTWPEVILTGSQLDRKHGRIKRWRSPRVLEVSVTNNSVSQT